MGRPSSLVWAIRGMAGRVARALEMEPPRATRNQPESIRIFVWRVTFKIN